MVESPEEYQALVETYGPLYPHAQFKRGETVRYRLPGFDGIYAGEVLWMQAPATIGSTRLPLRYVVKCQERDFVDVIFTTDIIRPEPT